MSRFEELAEARAEVRAEKRYAAEARAAAKRDNVAKEGQK